jgi:hypothetical protein
MHPTHIKIAEVKLEILKKRGQLEIVIADRKVILRDS